MTTVWQEDIAARGLAVRELVHEVHFVDVMSGKLVARAPVTVLLHVLTAPGWRARWESFLKMTDKHLGSVVQMGVFNDYVLTQREAEQRQFPMKKPKAASKKKAAKKAEPAKKGRARAPWSSTPRSPWSSRDDDTTLSTKWRPNIDEAALRPVKEAHDKRTAARVCTCSHASWDHQIKLGVGLQGACLYEGCECKGFALSTEVP